MVLDLYSQVREDQFYRHMSTTTGEYTNLDFVGYWFEDVAKLFKLQPHKMTILRIKSNAIVPEHIDGVKERNTVIIFPLSPYGPDFKGCDTKHSGCIPWYPCYAFNTQLPHSVYNNEHDRISLQLFYDMPIEEVHEIYVENMLLNTDS